MSPFTSSHAPTSSLSCFSQSPLPEFHQTPSRGPSWFPLRPSWLSAAPTPIPHPSSCPSIFIDVMQPLLQAHSPPAVQAASNLSCTERARPHLASPPFLLSWDSHGFCTGLALPSPVPSLTVASGPTLTPPLLLCPEVQEPS
jgi:hypothetical protein